MAMPHLINISSDHFRSGKRKLKREGHRLETDCPAAWFRGQNQGLTVPALEPYRKAV
jgi:hypothetical protein